MKLLTKAIEKKLPPIGTIDAVLEATDRQPADPMVWVKFFCPWSNWTWYGIEYDPEDKIFFGYVEGLENELGDFSLTEIEELRGPFGLTIERDMYFEPIRLSQIPSRKGKAL